MLRVIFLTGHRKSGTTMFHKLFDGHPGLAVYPHDLALLYAYFPCFVAEKNLNEQDLKDRIEKVIKSKLGRIKSKATLTDADLDIDHYVRVFWRNMTGKSLYSRGDIITGIAESWIEFSRTAKDVTFVVKETSQGIHFSEIKKTIPGCKFMSIVRDPRDNYAALKAGVKGYYAHFGEGEQETLASLINRSRMDMLAATLYSREYPDQFLAVKFEDLTSNPEATMRKVARFAGIEFHPCLLHPTVFGKLYGGNSYEGKKFSTISSENVGRWTDRISEHEAKIIEFWLGDVMQQWGYARCFPEAESAAAFAEFYKWYNCKYFYSDTFENNQKI